MIKKNGFAQIPLMIGLLLMAVAVPIVTQLAQKNQENRSSAVMTEGCQITGCAAGYKCNAQGNCVPNSTVSTPKPTARATDKPPVDRNTPVPTARPTYCSPIMLTDCINGCNPTVNGGECRASSGPTATPVATKKTCILKKCSGTTCASTTVQVAINQACPVSTCADNYACGAPQPTAVPTKSSQTTVVPTGQPVLCTSISCTGSQVSIPMGLGYCFCGPSPAAASTCSVENSTVCSGQYRMTCRLQYRADLLKNVLQWAKDEFCNGTNCACGITPTPTKIPTLTPTAAVPTPAGTCTSSSPKTCSGGISFFCSCSSGYGNNYCAWKSEGVPCITNTPTPTPTVPKISCPVGAANRCNNGMMQRCQCTLGADCHWEDSGTACGTPTPSTKPSSSSCTSAGQSCTINNVAGKCTWTTSGSIGYYYCLANVLSPTPTKVPTKTPSLTPTSANTCNGQCITYASTCFNVGLGEGIGRCAGGNGVCCSKNTMTSTPAPACNGQCITYASTCYNVGLGDGVGRCAGGNGVCCSKNTMTTTPAKPSTIPTYKPGTTATVTKAPNLTPGGGNPTAIPTKPNGGGNPTAGPTNPGGGTCTTPGDINHCNCDAWNGSKWVMNNGCGAKKAGQACGTQWDGTWYPTPTGSPPSCVTPPATTACKQCPSTFSCYSLNGEYKWFATGMQMTGFNLESVETNCLAVTPKPAFLGKTKGDANCDGKINTADYSLWHKEFYDGNAGTMVSKTWNADFTGPAGVCDGKVNTADYSLWHKYFYELMGNN